MEGFCDGTGACVPAPRAFKFGLGDRVELTESAEDGLVIGRAEYLHGENVYLIRYVAGDDRQTEAWWGESALTTY